MQLCKPCPLRHHPTARERELMAKNGVEELLTVGQASQESSDACNAVLDCCLQNVSYSPPIYHPGYGLFCYSQDPSPPVFYNSDFEEYVNLQQCVIKPPC